MKFNLVVAVVLSIACVVIVGQHTTALLGEFSWRLMLLVLCLIAAVAILGWRIRVRHQEPAVFVAVTYLSLGAVVAVAEAASGDYTRAIIIAVTAPIIPGFVVGDPRTRRWVNRIAGYSSDSPKIGHE
ncbi:hypothetical protein DBV08_18045 [Rhodococcus sp. KBW08]|uniref:hypothetical protein n=1 Tax=Rhodococcus sp. KBW08 TaxID=2144188 RepID=UPI000F5A475B|nr:hypothetical protein [Rhodococcus sp. KBW08]RQO46054.1 hypothetical protein DBV08_18045 [Rhodococcus sp. KBW08]